MDHQELILSGLDLDVLCKIDGVLKVKGCKVLSHRLSYCTVGRNLQFYLPNL